LAGFRARQRASAAAQNMERGLLHGGGAVHYSDGNIRDSPPGFADLKILATDISTVVLKKAAEGVYTEDKVKNVPEALRRKYFLKGVKEWEGFYRVRENLRFPIEFVRLNLKESFSFKEPFDVIFCRNVMIYFDRKMQQLVVGRFHDCLKEGGWLFIGHSESLTGITHRFKYIEPSVYRK